MAKRTTTVEVVGLTELLRNLEKLRSDVERNVVRAGIRAGLETIARAAAQKAPADTGKLKGAIKTRTRTRRGDVRGEVYVDYSVAPHAHLQEFGHYIVRKNRAGFKRVVGEVGSNPANGFMRPALYENERAILEGFRDATGAALQRAGRRAARRGESVLR